jgi:hypothetical protein
VFFLSSHCVRPVLIKATPPLEEAVTDNPAEKSGNQLPLPLETSAGVTTLPIQFDQLAAIADPLAFPVFKGIYIIRLPIRFISCLLALRILYSMQVFMYRLYQVLLSLQCIQKIQPAI